MSLWKISELQAHNYRPEGRWIGNIAHLPHLAMTLNKLLFPTLGIPTIPIFKLLEGRPKRAFFSTTVFLGGILFLMKLVDVEMKESADEVVNKRAGERWSKRWGRGVQPEAECSLTKASWLQRTEIRHGWKEVSSDRDRKRKETRLIRFEFDRTPPPAWTHRSARKQEIKFSTLVISLFTYVLQYLHV